MRSCELLIFFFKILLYVMNQKHDLELVQPHFDFGYEIFSFASVHGSKICITLLLDSSYCVFSFLTGHTNLTCIHKQWYSFLWIQINHSFFSLFNILQCTYTLNSYCSQNRIKKSVGVRRETTCEGMYYCIPEQGFLSQQQ